MQITQRKYIYTRWLSSLSIWCFIVLQLFDISPEAICFLLGFGAVQLGNILGHFQWMTCPRKVIVCEILKHCTTGYFTIIEVLALTITTCRIYLLAGFVVILTRCLSLSITLYHNGLLDGWVFMKVLLADEALGSKIQFESYLQFKYINEHFLHLT